MKGVVMADGRRNAPCSCGSGRKAKRCCGIRRGPSESDLARAGLACRDAGRVDAVVASAAVVELATAPVSRLLRNSLVEALAVSAGAAETPGGILVAAR